MVAPIIWAFGMGVLALASCRDGGSATEEETPTPDGLVPPPKPNKDGAIDSEERHRYQPPDIFTMPQATSEGIFYHPFFTQEGVQTNLGFPRWLRCREEKCYFVSGNKLLSFANNAETLANEDPISVTITADFAPEVDGITTHITDLLMEGSLVYALYHGVGAERVNDGGVSDGGVSDASISDASISDASISDASIADAGTSDGGVSDGGVGDGGVSDGVIGDGAVSDGSSGDVAVRMGQLHSGIAIRRLPQDNPKEVEAAPESFSFSELDKMENYCPSRLLLFGGTLWFSAANCLEEENRGAGLIGGLRVEALGSLVPSDFDPFETSYKYPESLWVMDGGDGTIYFTALASGETSLAGETLSESGLDVFDFRSGGMSPIAQIPLGEAQAFGMRLRSDQLVSFHGSLSEPNLYVTDLLKMSSDLLKDGTSDDPIVLNNVPLSDATNPVRFLPPGLQIPPPPPEISGVNSFFAFDYQPELQTALASYFHGRLVYVQLPTTTSTAGAALLPGFGDITGHYHCNKITTEYCGPVSFLPEGGAVALTGAPVSVTYLPAERLAQVQEQ